MAARARRRRTNTRKTATIAWRKCIAEPADGDRHALGIALLAVGARLVLGRHLVEVVHPDDAHVRAGGDGLDAVLGLASLERPQPRTEAEEELGDLHARLLGGDVVTELVEDDHHDDRADDEQQLPAAGQHRAAR